MKRIFALAVTIALFALLFHKVDRPALFANLRATHAGWFSLAIAMFVPQVWAIALRWRRLVRVFTPISWNESVGLILASNTMNLVLPSKLGDLSKGYFLYRTGALDLKRSMNVVVFEKMLDVASLAAFMLAGVVLMLARGGALPVALPAVLAAAGIGLLAVGLVAALYVIPLNSFPGMPALMRFLGSRPKLHRFRDLLQSSHEVLALLRAKGAQPWTIVVLSGLIWVFHLVQISFFFLALGAAAPLGQFASLVPLAIFVGLLPLSIGGFGTRDTALILFFPQFAPSVMLGVALYVNLRYILPAVAGIPYLMRYMAYAKEARAAVK